MTGILIWIITTPIKLLWFVLKTLVSIIVTPIKMIVIGLIIRLLMFVVFVGIIAGLIYFLVIK